MAEAQVAQYKKDIVNEFANMFSEYPIIGAVNMENLPTPQLQNMRKTLREKGIVLKMTKRRLMKIAIEQVKDKKKDIEKLVPNLIGMPALIFTKENPFKLYKLLQKSKSKAPAKGGQNAPNDIVIKAGPTPFAPGPIIGELGMAGIKTCIEGGKVAIKADKVVVKEGEVIKPKIAEILSRLGIEPMEVGLDLVATYEKGTIFTKDILAVDEQEYIDKITQAGSWAFNLAMEMAYPTKDTIELLVSKSFYNAKAVALESNFMADAVVEELLAKAHSEMMALKAEAKIEVVEKKVEEKKEEVKVEEKKPKPEIKPEEKKPEIKEEAPKVEEEKESEPKHEVKEEEVKPEIPKVEEKKPEPRPEVKEEPKKEEVKPEAPKVREKKEPSSEELLEKLKKQGTLREPEKKEEKKPEPPKTKKEMQKQPPKPEVKKEVKKKSDIPSAEDLIKKTKESFYKGKKVAQKKTQPFAEKIVENLKAKEPKKEQKPAKQKDDIPTAHELFERLKKKGTLRGEFKEKVPSIAELAEKKKEK